MKYWQRNRNYRKYKYPDGSLRYFIFVDGVNVEVTAEIFRAYSRADRRERYLYEREQGMMLSLERMADDNVPLRYLADIHIESAEDAIARKMLISEARESLLRLKPDEQRLIQAVVMDGVTEGNYAARLGVSQVAVHKRKHRLLKKLHHLMGY